MTNRSVEVERYLTALEHPMKSGVQRLRSAILDSDAGISECIKWNAPSFRYDGADRVTFRLHPRGQCQLVFHCGARSRGEFRFDDPSGLLVWRGPDRAVVSFADEAAITAQQDAVVDLVNAWVRS